MTTPQQVDRMRDAWLDAAADEDDQCPDCGEGYVDGDRYEWWCSENCGYHGDNIPEELFNQ